MHIEAKTKFEIGQVCGVVGSTNRFVVTGIVTDTCPAGTQIHYNGMFLGKGLASFTKPPQFEALKLEKFFPETLLEELKPEAKEE